MSEDKKDMTRIEDLSEFLHESDPEIDAQLEENSDSDSSIEDESHDDTEELASIDDFDDDNDNEIENSDFDSTDETNEFGSEYSDDEETFNNESNDFQENQDNFEEISESSLDESFEDSSDESNHENSNEKENEEPFFDSNDDQITENSFSDSGDFSESEDLESEDINHVDDDLDEHADFDNETENIHTEQEQNLTESQENHSFESSEESIEINNEFQETQDTFSDDSYQDLEQESVIKEDHSSDSRNQLDNEDPVISSYEQQDVEKEIKRENFADIKNFANSISHGHVASGGNPPFSIILKNLIYEEDSEKIKQVLQEHGLMNNSSQNEIEQGLSNGNLLISQISEYAAIVLAHKFRNLSLDVQLGLSEELHKSPNYTNSSKGLVSKENISQNKTEHLDLKKNAFDIENIIVTTTPNLEDYKIERYINIISDHTLVDEEMLRDNSSCEDISELAENIEFSHENNESFNFNTIGLNEIYKQLAENLKIKAIKLNGNAIVGVNYHITPVIENDGERVYTKYKIVCIGNVVLVSN